MTSYHGEPISNVDLNEIFRLRDEDHLIDNIVDINLDLSLEPRVQETEKRNLLIQDAEDNGCSHVIVIDSDEYYTRKSFERGLDMIDEQDAECSYCQYCNYGVNYKSLLVYPFEGGMYVPFVSKTKYRHKFDCTDWPYPSDPTRRFVLPFDKVINDIDQNGKTIQRKHFTVTPLKFEWNQVHMHHLSWLRADIRKKLENWSSKTVFENYDDLIDQAVYCFENYDEEQSNGKLKMLFHTPGNMVDVSPLPKQYIHPKVDYKTRLRPAKDYKRLLFLSMSANMSPFNELEKVCNETWRNVDYEKYPNINADFWTYTDAKPGEPTHVDKDNHIIYIKLDTTHVNSIDATYSKTIEALYVIRDELKLKYDYLIRTNNSTWINVPLVNEFLSYHNDDSKMYCAKLYSAFWSAFNVFAGGQFMVFSNRNVNIILRICGSVKDAKEFESKVVACDDNMICGKWNERLINLGIPYNNEYHSLGGVDLYEKEINTEEIDFTYPTYQVKTYGTEDRVHYDSEKMRTIDNLWRNANLNLDDLYNTMMAEHYDKEIVIIPYTKKEWFDLGDDKNEINLKFNPEYRHERIKGLKFLIEHQKKCGYKPGIFI